jgi:mono/diheme cytochrome c family protein
MRRYRRRGAWTLTVMVAAALFCVTQLPAQTAPDARKGLELARAICAPCHAVERGNLRSINPSATAFSDLATWPAMSELALRAALQSAHQRMPDIVLTRTDRDDIVAYIVSLKED